jgi:hypothetical protein
MVMQQPRWFSSLLTRLAPSGEGQLPHVAPNAPGAIEAAPVDTGDASTAAPFDPEAADLRVWCFALGFDESAAALRPLAPHAVADQRRRSSPSCGSVDDLLTSLRAYAADHPGFAGARAAQALARLEDARWQ